MQCIPTALEGRQDLEGVRWNGVGELRGRPGYRLGVETSVRQRSRSAASDDFRSRLQRQSARFQSGAVIENHWAAAKGVIYHHSKRSQRLDSRCGRSPS